MGFFAGGGVKALTTANSNIGLAPLNVKWFQFSASTAPVIVLIWIGSTFGSYSSAYGFMAIGEVLVGTFIAGLISHESRVLLAMTALPVTILAWVVL